MDNFEEENRSRKDFLIFCRKLNYYYYNVKYFVMMCLIGFLGNLKLFGCFYGKCLNIGSII